MTRAGVQSINNVYANVNKVQNSFIDALIFGLIDNGVYVVYALYSSAAKKILQPILESKISDQRKSGILGVFLQFFVMRPKNQYFWQIFHGIYSKDSLTISRINIFLFQSNKKHCFIS